MSALPKEIEEAIDSMAAQAATGLLFDTISKDGLAGLAALAGGANGLGIVLGAPGGFSAAAPFSIPVPKPEAVKDEPKLAPEPETEISDLLAIGMLIKKLPYADMIELAEALQEALDTVDRHPEHGICLPEVLLATAEIVIEEAED